MMRRQVHHAVVEMSEGDLTVQDVDAIVNAANSRLIPGGGVDGAIHRAAGRELAAACAAIGRCPPGEARLTPGFRLPARYVIHTVGPIYRGTQHDAEVLAAAHRSSLQVAAAQGLASIAFPAISTGVYGYPVEKAAPVVLAAVRDFLATDTTLRLVRFVLWDTTTFAAFRRALDQLTIEALP
jgi:O-acetyl-ADP-ribose deacetylase (regulator of RNase III)